jgi:DNA repair exonuclease SbcCD ATPase subunit
MEISTAPKKPAITIEDVRTALADTHPSEVSAAVLRERLGRGSFETIQRHLRTLRDERISETKPAAVAVPPPEEGLVRALWSAAWLAARQESLTRIDALSMQRDDALAQLQALEDDGLGMAKARDEAEQAADDQRIRFAAEVEKLNVDATSAKAETLRLQSQLQEAIARIQKLKDESEHSHEIAERDAELKDRAHQRDREHLLNQLAELKSAIHSLQTPRLNPSMAASGNPAV